MSLSTPPSLTLTPFDIAHAAMEADPENDALRLALFSRLADTELFILLEAEPVGEAIIPQTFETEEGDFILAFDQEERLSAFAQGPVPYAALPGRVIAQSLIGENTGLGINLDVAQSAMLLPPEALEWLANTLTHQPEPEEARITAFHAPALPPAILASLMPAFDAKFETLRGLATHALLAGVTYEGGRRGHVLAILGAHESSEAGLAKAMSEALMFSGIEAGELDVIFISPDDSGADDLLAKALVLVIPEREEETAQIVEHKAPGMDPTKPPILR
ncbi:SseB family protein [Albirhodobacter sp. R86504]|uniref:SseB family protein n=1 Tax=Albirhodobacter sp. R86504 TaxID=3093848 RepID=UPI00366BB237